MSDQLQAEAAARAALSATQPKSTDDLLSCEIAPRPLRYSLTDYHRAGSDGPLHAQWQDKPHRLLYDLIAAVRYYAASQAPAVVADDARDAARYRWWRDSPDSPIANEPRATDAWIDAAMAASQPSAHGSQP